MNNRQLNALSCRQKQQGFSLIMALSFMVFLTLIVISMVNITSSDEKIARNTRDKDLAFAAAEAAMRDAEMDISGSYEMPYQNPRRLADSDTTCTNAFCDFTDSSSSQVNLAQLDFFAATGMGSKSMELGTVTKSPQIKGVNAQPRYMIEVVNRITDPYYEYRITVQSQGKSSNTRVTLQQLYFPATAPD